MGSSDYNGKYLRHYVAAQHDEQKEQERQKGRKRKKTFTAATFLGEERVQNHPSITKHLPGGALPTGRPAHQDRIIGAIQKEQKAHNLKIRTFTDQIKGIKKRLTDARVQTKLHPILARLSIEGMHQDPLYPYGTYPELPTNKELVEAAFQPPTLSQRPPTPIPPMRYPTPPNKPSRVLPTVWSPSPALEYSIEVFAAGQPLAAESLYLPVTPTDPPIVERAHTPPSDRLSPRPDSPPDRGQSLS